MVRMTRLSDHFTVQVRESLDSDATVVHVSFMPHVTTSLSASEQLRDPKALEVVKRKAIEMLEAQILDLVAESEDAKT